MFVDNPNHKGNVAELAIATEAARLGLSVLKPLTEHERYDLAFGIGGELLRVQCKWGAQKGDVVSCTLESITAVARVATSDGRTDESRSMPSPSTATTLDACFLLPIEMVAGTVDRAAATWRQPETVSARRLHFAADYELRGCSSAGRALGWHRERPGFESLQLHFTEDLTVRRLGRGGRSPVPQPLRLLHGARRCRDRDPDPPPRQALCPPRTCPVTGLARRNERKEERFRSRIGQSLEGGYPSGGYQ